jgi:putative oxidoreductase
MAASIALIVARLLLAWMFLASGYAALSDISGTTGYFAGLGLPMPLLVAWGVGVFELLGGVSLVAGYQTRLAAPVLAAFSIAATFLGHYGQGGGDAALAFLHMQALMKDVAVAGGLMALAVAGPGRLSLDALIRSR